jgi:hypothetical protein
MPTSCRSNIAAKPRLALARLRAKPITDHHSFASDSTLTDPPRRRRIERGCLGRPTTKTEADFSDKRQPTGRQIIKDVGIAVFEAKSLPPFIRQGIALNSKVDPTFVNDCIFHGHESGYMAHMVQSIFQKSLIDDSQWFDTIWRRADPQNRTDQIAAGPRLGTDCIASPANHR